MAFDSRENRVSALGLVWFAIAPIADAAIDTADRPQITGIYAGLTYPSPAETAGDRIRPDYFQAVLRRSRYTTGYGRV